MKTKAIGVEAEAVEEIAASTSLFAAPCISITVENIKTKHYFLKADDFNYLW